MIRLHRQCTFSKYWQACSSSVGRMQSAAPSLVPKAITRRQRHLRVVGLMYVFARSLSRISVLPDAKVQFHLLDHHIIPH